MNVTRTILLTILFVLLSFSSQAQQEKQRIAVLDPTTSGLAMDDGTKLAVQELISATVVNTGQYNIIERSMLEKIIKEQVFQNSDIADNTQATEIGRLAGASKVVLAAVSMVGGRIMLSVKMIDVATAGVEKQKAKVVPSNDLLDAVEPLTLELLGEEVVQGSRNTPQTQQKGPQRKSGAYVQRDESFTGRNDLFEDTEESQKVVRQISAAIDAAERWSDPRLENALASGVVSERITLSSGALLTLSATGILTIEGAGEIAVPEDSLVAKQLSFATVVIVGEGITKIGGLSSKNVHYVLLPSTLEAIDDGCFKGSRELVAVNIPSGVRRIGRKAFGHCESIQELYVPNSVVSLGEECFNNMHGLKEIHLSENIAKIPVQAFDNCKSLTHVVVPASVEAVEESAFEDCENLYRVVFRSQHLAKIGEECFSDCERLNEIVLYSRVPPVCKGRIFDTKEKSDKRYRSRVVVSVLPSAVSEFKSEKYWGEFDTIAAMSK